MDHTSQKPQPPHDEVHAERKKLKWFLGFVIVVLFITAGTDIIFFFYGSPTIPKERDPFVTVESKTTPTPFFTPIPSTSPSSVPFATPTRSSVNQTITPVTKICPMDAKECPDGKTFVGRSGPNCEFVACPK